MAVTTQTSTSLARAITGIGDDDARKAVLTQVHPRVQELRPSWAVLADAYEGDGGFLTGEYLDQFPAEMTADFDKRKAQVRYHNFLETLIDLYVRHCCSQGVSRATTNAELQAWWDDVDGTGTSIQDFMRGVAAHALNLGHCAVLVDKTPDAPLGPSKADERARVIATRFPATSLLDWQLTDRQDLAAVKLLEAAPEGALTAEPTDDAAAQYALWNQTEFARFDQDGALVGEDGTHGLGLVPVAILRPKPSTKYAVVGRPLVRADVIKALLNRASEEDHVLRAQGFSLLTVAVPHDAGDDVVEATLAAVANNFGTTRALVVRGTVDYASPDMAIPAAIRENMQFLIRELFRAAHVPYEQDSRDAESAESRRLKNAELNEMLRALAQALTACELRMARFWCGWSSNTPDEAERLFKAAAVSVQYPTEFFTHELIDDLQAWGESVKFGLGETFEKRLKKRAVRRIEPDMPAPDLQKVDAEIDALPTAQQLKEAEAQKRAQEMRDRFAPALAAAGTPPPTPAAPPEGQAAV